LESKHLRASVSHSTDSSREIIDESDVFIDVHKAIRRMTPAPRARVPKGAIVSDVSHPSERKLSSTTIPRVDAENGEHKPSLSDLATSPKAATYLMRRRSSGNNGSMERSTLAIPLRPDDPEVMRHLKHLGPSNSANRPKSTRINTVKIKPGIPSTIPENGTKPQDGAAFTSPHAPQGGVGEGLLENAGREASDGVHNLMVGYGTISQHADRTSGKDGRSGPNQPADHDPQSPKSAIADENTALVADNNNRQDASQPKRSKSVSTIGSLHSVRSRSKSPPKKRHTARSGSISENIIDVNGVKKIVLEMNSSSDSEDRGRSRSEGTHSKSPESDAKSADHADHAGKKRRKKRGKKKKAGGEGAESEPLLGGERS